MLSRSCKQRDVTEFKSNLTRELQGMQMLPVTATLCDINRTKVNGQHYNQGHANSLINCRYNRICP